MTPRKELFIKIKAALNTISSLEYIDLNRNQFSNGKENYPTLFTAALIKVRSIRWQTMVEQRQEGTCTIDIDFYSLDGFADQQNGTADPDDGLTELDLIDSIVEKLQGLTGETFKQLDLSDETDLDLVDVQMSYQLSFTTLIYRKINPKYTNRTVTVTLP